MQYTVLSVDGLKGTMSEAELHIIRARLDGGIRNKAARGELRRGLPVGFIWGEQDGEVLCIRQSKYRVDDGKNQREAQTAGVSSVMRCMGNAAKPGKILAR